MRMSNTGEDRTHSSLSMKLSSSVRSVLQFQFHDTQHHVGIKRTRKVPPVNSSPFWTLSFKIWRLDIHKHNFLRLSYFILWYFDFHTSPFYFTRFDVEIDFILMWMRSRMNDQSTDWKVTCLRCISQFSFLHGHFGFSSEIEIQSIMWFLACFHFIAHSFYFVVTWPHHK